MTGRVIRGGSWNNNARNCRSANRNNNTPDNRNNNNGFRVACTPASEGTFPVTPESRFFESGSAPCPESFSVSCPGRPLARVKQKDPGGCQ